MTVNEQLNIINNFIRGIPIYYRSKYTSDEFKWKLVEKEHQFDFESNVYHENTPPTFEEALAQVEPYKAFHMAINRLEKNALNFVRECSVKDEHEREIDRFRVVKLNDLYMLWNIASNYGRLRAEELKYLTEDEGKIDRGFL